MLPLPLYSSPPCRIFLQMAYPYKNWPAHGACIRSEYCRSGILPGSPSPTSCDKKTASAAPWAWDWQPKAQNVANLKMHI